MDSIELKKILAWSLLHKEERLHGRYITYKHIEPIIKNLPEAFKVEKIGHSYKGIPIHKIAIGTGATKILIWSQMHGNESTGTKAVFDFFKWITDIDNHSDKISQIVKACTLVFIPMLNPDGAKAYTRVNAQDIDLNRDAVDLIASESKLLQSVLKEVNPKFCFNLHDQRTIFSVGDKPATISFLAPSEDITRKITESRKITMAVISAMFQTLNKLIPGQIGRYTDEFYPTATGDNFQKAGHHTILIEAGHFKDDYDREEVRKFYFIALLSGIKYIACEENFDAYHPYLSIPNNEKKYLDIIYKKIFLSDEQSMVDVGIVFKEILKDRQIIFKPIIEHVSYLSGYYANQIIDKKGESFKNKSTLTSLYEK